MSRTLAPQQAEWLQSQGVDTDRPATEQTGRLDDILAQAQIEVVEAMRSEEKRKELSADDRVFLKSKDINPEIPAADQEVRIEKLLDKLEKEAALSEDKGDVRNELLALALFALLLIAQHLRVC